MAPERTEVLELLEIFDPRLGGSAWEFFDASTTTDAGRPAVKTALTRRRIDDTSPLRGLASANAAFAYANVFVPSSLRRFPARPVPAPLAYANVLILWDGGSFAPFSKSL